MDTNLLVYMFKNRILSTKSMLIDYFYFLNWSLNKVFLCSQIDSNAFFIFFNLALIFTINESDGWENLYKKNDKGKLWIRRFIIFKFAYLDWE